MNQFHIFALADATSGWAQVLRVGHFAHPSYGDFDVTAEDLAVMVANFREGVRPKPPTRLVVDYNHGDQSGKAAGWITELDTRADGTELWAQVEWTEEAAAAIAAKQFQFTSAEFAWAYQDKESGQDRGPTLLAMAITNRPFVEGMQPLALSEQVSRAIYVEAKRSDAQPLQGLPGRAGKENVMETQLRQLLGLAEDADVLAAVRMLRDTQGVALTERNDLQVRLAEITSERDAFKAKLATAERDTLVAKYEAEGKLTPIMRSKWADEMALTDPERFVALMETMPISVELGERGSDGGGDAQVKLTEAEIAIARQLGLKEEDVVRAKATAPR